MSKTYVPVALRRHITELSRHRCGYCLRTEELMGMSMTIEHIIPEALGGTTTENNLWLACPSCNQFKGSKIKAHDPESEKLVKLFNPRTQNWNEHFQWNIDGSQILGKTACGRATVVALNMNNAEIVITRKLWVSAGWWPLDD